MTSTLRAATKSTRADGRQSNLRLALQTILHAQPLSRADIARETGLTRATVSDLVTDLIEQALVEEAGRGVSAGGKPPTMLRIAAHARAVVAVDLSARPFRAALLDLAGAASHQREADGRDLAAVVRLVQATAAAADVPVLGIGVGTPGVVDDGVVLEAANLDWHEVDLRQALVDATGLPVHVANDAHVAAIDEFGRRADSDSVVVVRLADGIGAGIVLDGRLHRGDGQAAGEVGHLPVPGATATCRCGRVGCLETVAGLDAILEAAGQSTDGTPDERRVRLADVPDDVADRAGRAVGAVLAMVVGVLDVHRVVLAGPALALGGRLLGPVRDELARHVLPSVADRITVEASEVGEDVVLAGAWSLVVSNELGVVGR